MKKNIALFVLLAFIEVLTAPGWAAWGTAPRPGVSTSLGQAAAASQDLIKLLPRSTTFVVVLDFKKLLAIDPIVKAMQDPNFKGGYDEFVKTSGIDIEKDVTYVGIGAPAFVDASPHAMPMSEAYYKNVSIVINLKYDQARLQGLIKEKIPEAKEEMYNEVTVYSNIDDADKPTTPRVLAELGKMGFLVAFLDASHLVLGSDAGVKGVIDVYRKRAEPLAKNPEMSALMGRADKSGIAWCAASYPAEYIKKLVDSNPQIKAIKGLAGMTMVFDDKNSTLIADLKTLGGTKEQNTTFASNLNALKFLGAMSAAQEPALVELLNGIAITSGNDYTRTTLAVSHETLGKLWRLAESKGEGWPALFMEADELYSKGEYKRATEVGKQALELAEKALGPDNIDVAVVLNRLSRSYIAQGQFAEAETLVKRSLDIREKALGPDHPDVAANLGALAELYCAQDRSPEAEPLFKRSLAILEKAFGPDDPKGDLALESLAHLYNSQHRYAEAGPLLKRLLAIREKALGPDHSDVAESLHELAVFYLIQGQFAEAEALDKRSLEIMEKAVGPDHPDVAARLNDLAGLYRTQGRHSQAEPLLKRSLAIVEKALGPDDPQVAESLNELAIFYYTWGRHAQAEPLFLRSLAIREKALGPDHHDVALSLESLAQLYRATGRMKEAEEFWSRAARIRSIKR